jgi:hypothetical protein
MFNFFLGKPSGIGVNVDPSQKIDKHIKSEVIDHVNGSVTEQKLSTELQTKINDTESSGAVNAHNTSETAHTDIRGLFANYYTKTNVDSLIENIYLTGFTNLNYNNYTIPKIYNITKIGMFFDTKHCTLIVSSYTDEMVESISQTLIDETGSIKNRQRTDGVWGDWKENHFGTDTNHTLFESDGTLKMVGDATVYKDLIFPVSNLRVGASPPTFAGFQNGVYANRFDNTFVHTVYGSVELQHDYEEGSELEVHIHWSPSTTNTGVAKFSFEYTIASVNGIFGVSTTATAIQAGSGTVNKHHYLTLATISGTNRKIGDIICFAFSRLGNHPEDTFTGNAFIHSIGVHYKCDTIGSRTTSAK